MIDFPASPVLNQTFTAPSGVTYRCTSAAPVVWTSMATQTSVPEAPIDGHYYARKDAAWAEDPPFPEAPTDNLYYARRNVQWVAMTKAGAGLDQVDNTSDVNKPVSTAQANADALRVLKTGDTMTGPLQHPDGTQAAPSIAFTSEPGLGWYRFGAGGMAAAAGGRVTSYLDATSATTTKFGLQPRAAGATQITLGNGPDGAVNYNGVALSQNADGSSSIANFVSGTATAKNMNFTGAATYSFDNGITTGSKNIVGANGMGMVWDGGNGNYLMMGSGNSTKWSWVWDRTGNTLTWKDAVSATLFSIDSGGRTYVPYGHNTPNVWAAAGSSELNLFGATNSGSWPSIGGGLVTIRSTGSPNYAVGSCTVYSGTGGTGATLAGGATAWSATSDERLKNIDSEVTDGLAAVLAMRPIRYRYKTDEPTARMRIGLSAQSVQPNVPEAITEVPLIGSDGNLTAESYLNLAITDVIPHMIAAIKELKAQNDALVARIAALEATP
jgi:Chaperone of endosialidase